MARAAGFAAVLASGCAHIEAPPGGPADTQGPQLLTTRPDTLARMESFAGPVVLVFDEGLSEERVQEAVEVSPRTSAVSVEKRGDEIRVDLRRGWERGRIYQVTVEPIVRDRFGNEITAPVLLVFSTGPEIPDTRLTGRVLDRQTAGPAQRVRVEAILAPDSLVYATRTDSAGGFEFRRIPAGTYAVRAFNDPNASRALEESEARDTTVATLAVGAAPEVALSIVRPDSTPPRLTSGAGDAVTLTLRFDDFLDAAQPMQEVRVEVFGPDSTPVAVAEVGIGSLQPPADSAARDTLAQDTVPADTTAPPLPAPSQTLTVRLQAPLASEATYRVTVSGVRNLVGLSGGGTVQFRAPRVRPPAAPAQADTADAAPAEPPPETIPVVPVDSVGAPPPAGPPPARSPR